MAAPAIGIAEKSAKGSLNTSFIAAPPAFPKAPNLSKNVSFLPSSFRSLALSTISPKNFSPNPNLFATKPKAFPVNPMLLFISFSTSNSSCSKPTVS